MDAWVIWKNEDRTMRKGGLGWIENMLPSTEEFSKRRFHQSKTMNMVVGAMCPSHTETFSRRRKRTDKKTAQMILVGTRKDFRYSP